MKNCIDYNAVNIKYPDDCDKAVTLCDNNTVRLCNHGDKVFGVIERIYINDSMATVRINGISRFYKINDIESFRVGDKILGFHDGEIVSFSAKYCKTFIEYSLFDFLELSENARGIVTCINVKEGWVDVLL